MVLRKHIGNKHTCNPTTYLPFWGSQQTGPRYCNSYLQFIYSFCSGQHIYIQVY